LQVNAGLEAKTLFADLRRRFRAASATVNCGRLQRQIKSWRAQSGPGQRGLLRPGASSWSSGASDFTHGTKLGVTINGSPLSTCSSFRAHVLQLGCDHYLLSESLESLSEGLQNALWELGGAPQMHRTDRLTAAVQPGVEGPESFKQRYQAC